MISNPIYLFFPFIVALLFVCVILFYLSYKIKIKDGNLLEYYFYKLHRSIKISDINQIIKIRASYLKGYMHGPSYYLKGNFDFLRQFPFLKLEEGFLDTLLLLNPAIVMDSYLNFMLYKETREKLGLQLSGIDKVSDKIMNVIGYFLVAFMCLLISFIVIVVIIYYFHKYF